MCCLFSNGYSLFCKKYFRENSTSANSMKDVSAAWHQLTPAKKNHYHKKANKVCSILLFAFEHHLFSMLSL